MYVYIIHCMVYCNTFLEKKSYDVFRCLREFIFQNGRPNSKRVSPEISLASGHGGRNSNVICIMIDACFPTISSGI